MIPETITIPTREVIYFFSLACPSFLLGVFAGILLSAQNIKRAGYVMRYNKLARRLTLERIPARETSQ